MMLIPDNGVGSVLMYKLNKVGDMNPLPHNYFAGSYISKFNV